MSWEAKIIPETEGACRCLKKLMEVIKEDNKKWIELGRLDLNLCDNFLKIIWKNERILWLHIFILHAIWVKIKMGKEYTISYTYS